MHLTDSQRWHEARQTTGDPLVSSQPAEAHALVTVADGGWALLRCPMEPPFSVFMECCNNNGDDDGCTQRAVLWQAVQCVVRSVTH